MHKIYGHTLTAILLCFSLSSFSNTLTIYDGEKEIKLNEEFKISTCNAMSLAECPNCFDTPSYYFKTKTKKIISRCAGACWHPQGDQQRICKDLCPPPEWNCKEETHTDPMHSSDEVLIELFKQSKINKTEVNVSIFEFDYVKGLWHIELQPLGNACIDCYPAFYFKNQKTLILEKVPHG